MTLKEEIKFLRQEIELMRGEVERLRLSQPLFVPQPYPVYPSYPAFPTEPVYPTWGTGTTTDGVELGYVSANYTTC